METSRKQIAQTCVAMAGAAMLLPWHVDAGLGGNQTIRGIGIGEGRLLIVVCVVTIGLVRAAWRPAWIGAGFACAIAAREIVSPSGVGSPQAGLGTWIAAAAAGLAAALLVWDMLAGISSANGDGRGDGDADGPTRRGLSGPLGRRR